MSKLAELGGSNNGVRKTGVFPAARKVSKNDNIEYFKSISRKRLRRELPARIETFERKSKENVGNTYRPYSKELILKLIHSYRSVANWSVPLSPLQALLSGWQCGRGNRLECISCKWSFQVRFPEDLADDLEFVEALKADYGQQLQDHHEPECPWKKRPAKAEVYQFGNEEYEIKALEGRLCNLSKHKQQLLQYKEKLPKLQDSELVLVREWSDRKDLSDEVIALGLGGWEIVPFQDDKLLGCQSCNEQYLLSAIEELTHDRWCCYNTQAWKRVLDYIKYDNRSN